ncbi:LuxR C-terminal-related transcriptional regulator [Streptomyces sp. NPDC101160]|uniref:LuxR C-terminal-related transcriptional regulator n=1 Tax=Streptomyces sp. NPDC101160 TaxID=3366118 RepID=UPI00381DEEAF
MGDPFLRTRFVPPERPATFLRRVRLAERLGQAPRTPLTVVEGRAGAGKTLLVADWAAGLDEPVAWLTLDAAIQGPGVFWAHFLQALRAGGTALPSSVGSPARAGEADHALLSRLAAELGGRDRPAIVVIDEFDRMTAPEVARQLEFVLHHGGAGLRLVLVTRTEPLLPLHRYRLAGETTEIRDAELAFTVEEAVTLLELHGLDLSDAAAGALVERTRGWAAGLRLCAMAARLSPDPEIYLKEFEAGRSTIADFLLAEVLDRQPPRTQDLLLRVSVLDRFRPELADALTGRQDAAPILAGLLRDNAFVEDFGQGWYRLHPLFREILRAHLRHRSPGLERDVHRRAAGWLRHSGTLPESLAHAAAAGDLAFAAGALVDDLAIGQLFAGPRADELAELFAALEPKTGRTEPKTETETETEAPGPAADLVRAARELSRHDLARGLAHLGRAEEQLTAGTGDSPAARLGCALLAALAGRLAGSVRQTEEAARSAAGLLRSVPVPLVDEHPELLALLWTHLGATRLWAGLLGEARAALTEVTRGPGDAATALPRRDSLEHLALIDYLDGWPGRAERRVRAATAETERFGLPAPAGPGLGQLVLAAVAVERDEPARAEELLGRPSDGPAPDPVTAAARRLATARLLLAQGRTRAASAAARQVVAADEDSPWARGHAALVVSAAHLAEGRPEAAAEVLRAVAADQPMCLVGAARAHLAAGDRAEALRLLDGLDDLHGNARPPGLDGNARPPGVDGSAGPSSPDGNAGLDDLFGNARPPRLHGNARLPGLDGDARLPGLDGNARPLGLDGDARPPGRAHVGPAVTVRAALVRARAAKLEGDLGAVHTLLERALREARPEELRRPFAEAGPWIGPFLEAAPLRALAAGWLLPEAGLDGEAAGPAAEEPLVEPLSEREHEVLERLARMMSTEDIAADLYLSVNTVKTHLKSVYRKLSVHRRNEAVRRARDLGLL